jgi:thiol reductant ABC exporter CydD subunit
LRRAAPVRWLLAVQTLLGTLTAFTIVAVAGCIGYGVGGAFDRHSIAPVLAVTPWLATAFVTRGLLAWLSDLVAVRAAVAVKSQLRREITEAYLRPGESQPDHGTVTTLISTGLDDLDGYFSRYLPQLVLAVTAPTVIGIAIATQDWLSAVIILATMPLIPIFMILVGWTTQDQTSRRWRVQARLAHHFADLVAGLPTLRAFGRARAQTEGLRRSGAAHQRETMGTLRIALLSALVLELLTTLSVAIVAVVIGVRVIAGDVSLSTSLFVLVLAPEAYLPLRKVGVHYHDAANGAAAARAALDLIERSPQTSPVAARPTPGVPAITLDSVGFHRNGRPILDGVDATIPRGSLTCLVGPSGSGKSTLLMILMGWLRPSVGSLRWDAVDLADLDPEAVRRQIAWVGQEPAMVASTAETAGASIADTVRLGFPAADDDAVRAALRSAGVHLDPDRILNVDDAGNLSGGERRRVALARAVLRVRQGGAGLMILDEPTAGLDPATELEAIELIKRLGVTALVVSHRPAVIDAADQVIDLGSYAARCDDGPRKAILAEVAA